MNHLLDLGQWKREPRSSDGSGSRGAPVKKHRKFARPPRPTVTSTNGLLPAPSRINRRSRRNESTPSSFLTRRSQRGNQKKDGIDATSKDPAEDRRRNVEKKRANP
ncbi:hypothetical protein KM043_005723 [Ampulex compressa]|nr:hypothetical protein KM043_005723 [Ampulex compressa]